MLSKIVLMAGKDANRATPRDWYIAAALTLRDRIVNHWLQSNHATHSGGDKCVYYLSLEFLIGRLFTDALSNLGLTGAFRTALEDFGVNFEALKTIEPDAALGNGGLGRLAACFMESMATLGIPARGYGIRYEHGLFRQIISDGWQEEFPEQWLRSGNPWEFERPEITYRVHYGGTLRHGEDGALQWLPGETVEAVAYDTPIVGAGEHHVNALRLWSARAVDPMNIEVFNSGDHLGAMSEMARAEAISKFLYPSDETPAGRELRLRQVYFFVSASLQDIIHDHLEGDGDLRMLDAHAAVQLNDTHPGLVVPELMRLLVDVHGIDWDAAWTITSRTVSYTNHTLLPEALETWPVELFERLLPRHLDMSTASTSATSQPPTCTRRATSASALGVADRRDRRPPRPHGHLAYVGSHHVNGVSAMHSDLMRSTWFADLNALYPGRITNKTNGITFRRWLHQCNPRLAALLREACGDAVLDDPQRLREAEKLCDDAPSSRSSRR